MQLITHKVFKSEASLTLRLAYVQLQGLLSYPQIHVRAFPPHKN